VAPDVGREICATVITLAEDLVRVEAFEPSHEGDIAAARLLSEGFDAITESGVLGDPRKATAEAGERIVEKVATAYAEQVEAERSGRQSVGVSVAQDRSASTGCRLAASYAGYSPERSAMVTPNPNASAKKGRFDESITTANVIGVK
jgi:creatinine amidohydrolase